MMSKADNGIKETKKKWKRIHWLLYVTDTTVAVAKVKDRFQNKRSLILYDF